MDASLNYILAAAGQPITCESVTAAPDIDNPQIHIQPTQSAERANLGCKHTQTTGYE
jgi:hypothetical protein